jgi:hypothetical protein
MLIRGFDDDDGIVVSDDSGVRVRIWSTLVIESEDDDGQWQIKGTLVAPLDRGPAGFAELTITSRDGGPLFTPDRWRDLDLDSVIQNAFASTATVMLPLATPEPAEDDPRWVEMSVERDDGARVMSDDAGDVLAPYLNATTARVIRSLLTEAVKPRRSSGTRSNAPTDDDLHELLALRREMSDELGTPPSLRSLAARFHRTHTLVDRWLKEAAKRGLTAEDDS